MASLVYTSIENIDITFEDGSVLNTWTDLHLIPTSKLYVSTFTPVIAKYEVPKSLTFSDSTTYISGQINYAPANSQIEFLRNIEDSEDIELIEYDLEEKLNGKKVFLKFSCMPNQTFEGWISLGGIDNSSTMRVTINYVIYPQ